MRISLCCIRSEWSYPCAFEAQAQAQARRPDWQAPYVDEDPLVGLGVGERLRRIRIILGMREPAPDGIVPARHSVIMASLKYYENEARNADV